MKFPWMPKGRGDYWPLLPVGFRRNLIFANFELRMTPSEFELIPLRRRR